MDDSVRPADDLVRVELHDSLHHFGTLLRWLETSGVEIVRCWPGQNVAHVRGPDEMIDGVAARWNLEGWVELTAVR